VLHGVTIVTKVEVKVTVAHFINNRMVGEWAMDPKGIAAHPTDPSPFSGGIDALCDASVRHVQGLISGSKQAPNAPPSSR
jgi:hypothetical protein